MSFICRTFVFASLCGLVLLLSACGGGGGDSSPGVPDALLGKPDAPVLSLTPQAISTFHFTWADVARETEYRLLEDPDAGSGYLQVATIAADSTSYDHEVFLPGRINARYILQACNADGCSNSDAVHVDGSLAEAIGYVKPSDTGAGDRFGIGVALSGDGATLAVGADQEGGSGAVYVFTRNGTAWNQQARLKASNAGAGDNFGIGVALSGDGATLAVGADQEEGSGAVYVFTRTGSAWSQQAHLKASNAGAGDQFGWTLALSDDGVTLAVGAYREDSSAIGINGDQDNNTAADSGAVYVFVRDGGIWNQQAYVKASNTDANDWFGWSVALADGGNTLAVGAIGESSNAVGIQGAEDNNIALGSGAVYVFIRTGTDWSQQAYVKASNTGIGDLFGRSLALNLDGITLAVGAAGEDSGSAGINGDQTNNSVTDSGAAYIFVRDGGTWSQQAYVKASNPGIENLFGHRLALSHDGNTLAVGAVREDSGAIGIEGDQFDGSAPDSGAVYVFARNLDTWSQQAYLKAANTGAGDLFGSSVALAGDGKTLAVGAPGEDGSATGIGGASDESAPDSGAVYLY